MRTQEGVRAEARTMELRAVAQLGRAAARSPTPPCRRPAAAPAAPAAPCAPPYGRSNSAVAPQSRRRASDIALWRRACASPTLSMRALPARTPCGRHRNPSSEPAGGSLLPPPPPSSAGAAAPSSLVLPICTEKNSVSKSPPQSTRFSRIALIGTLQGRCASPVQSITAGLSLFQQCYEYFAPLLTVRVVNSDSVSSRLDQPPTKALRMEFPSSAGIPSKGSGVPSTQPVAYQST